MGTLVCRVELDKNKGLILTVENKEGKITQTAVLNGQSITLTSKGQDDVSSIVQKPDGIAIKCKNFTLDSESITCTSTKDTLHKSKQKFDIQSTRDMSLKSEAKYSADASGDVSVSGKKVAVSALDKVEISGTNAIMSGKIKTEIKGAMTTVEGQMTTITGKLTKVG